MEFILAKELLCLESIFQFEHLSVLSFNFNRFQTATRLYEIVEFLLLWACCNSSLQVRYVVHIFLLTVISAFSMSDSFFE